MVSVHNSIRIAIAAICTVGHGTKGNCFARIRQAAFTAKLNKTSNLDRIASDAWADHLCWIATHSEKGAFFLMFDPQTAMVVSLGLGVFIGIAKLLRAPAMLLGGLPAFGIYYFLFLHNTLLGILKLIALGR